MKSTRKYILIVGVVLTLLFSIVGPASAITNGQPDNGRHPYVGLALFYVDGTPSWRCSGALLSPTVFLTAGHCTDGATSARVYMEENVTASTGYPLTGGFTGTPYTYPGFCLECGKGLPGFATGDVGIVKLDQPVTTVTTFAQLPTAGLVDTLAMKTSVDEVGYGVQFKQGTGVPPSQRWAGPRSRMYAPAQFVASHDRISSQFLKLTANPSQGKGGTCFGDSGGPNLLGGTNIVLGVNSFVTSYNCTGVTYSFRIDNPAVLAWIGTFLR